MAETLIPFGCYSFVSHLLTNKFIFKFVNLPSPLRKNEKKPVLGLNNLVLDASAAYELVEVGWAGTDNSIESISRVRTVISCIDHG